MNLSQKDFEQAWKVLTVTGEPCDKVAKAFAPIGICKDVKEEGPLYHGTKADLQIGDFITPGHPSNYGSREKPILYM